MRVLSLNRGSSSLKLAMYSFAADGAPRPLFSGNLERIGRPNAALVWHDFAGDRESRIEVDAPGRCAEAEELVDWLAARLAIDQADAIGHRVVHGGPRYVGPERIGEPLLAELRRIAPFDPDHLPAEIALIEAFGRQRPDVPQIACFDTAFHRSMPRVARLLPIPRKYERTGIERYGFHGLSFAYLMEELARIGRHECRSHPPDRQECLSSCPAEGRVILAHLGAGASLAAVRAGQSVDTSMAFTPAAGLPMATRSGDLDPGLVSFLARSEGMTAEGFDDLVNHRCGLVGLSETTGDVRELLALEKSDSRAAEALACFCYQTKKWIGAFAAALGGLETLVFSGGIGENSPAMRGRICEGLEFLGLNLDPGRNQENAPLVSAGSSRVAVRVIRTNEEFMIAKASYRLVN
jgi:acetate kinase